MRYPRSLLCVVAFLWLGGLANAASALPLEVLVTEPAQFEIMRNGQVTGRFSLAVGTSLDVENVEGEFVLVRFRNTRGRVPAKVTDLGARGGAAPVEPGQGFTPPTASSSPEARAVAKGPASAPTTNAMPFAMTGPGVSPPAGAIGWGLLIGMMIAMLVMIVAHWRLFTKAGKPGWAVLVPIYNLVLWQQISGKPAWWLLLYFVPVANLVVAVLTMFGLASNFGKGKGFGLGLLLAPFIFVPVLAFGDSQYVGT